MSKPTVTLRAGLFTKQGAPIRESDWPRRNDVPLATDTDRTRPAESLAEDLAPQIPRPWFLLVMTGRAYCLIWRERPDLPLEPHVIFDSRENS